MCGVLFGRHHFERKASLPPLVQLLTCHAGMYPIQRGSESVFLSIRSHPGHHTPVLPVLFLSGGRHLLQDMFRNRGILGVLFSKITPVHEHFVIRTGVILTVLFFKIPRFVNRGILGVLFSKLTPVRKLDHGVKVVICPSLEIARVVTLWPKRPILAAANVVWIKM